LPNWATLGGAAVALTWRFGYGGLDFFLVGFAGAAGAGAFLLLPFLMRGAGGGDVKMLFAAGAIAGWSRILSLLWTMSAAGLVMAVIMLLARRASGARLKHYLRSAVDWRYDRAEGARALPPRESEQVRMPFSIPIAFGLVMSLILR